MTLAYQAISWNRQKRVYDTVMAGGVLTFLAVFVVTGLVLHSEITAEALLIRALGTGAFLLLNVVLSIGPLCRVDPRFLPMLYNRRHMGVATFLLGAAHGGFALVQFHALGDVNPLVSVLTGNTDVQRLSEFPFEWFGLFALVLLFLMAATSHDFWLANLTAPVWKALHMGVYLAYAALVLHVVLGVLQAETSPWLVGVLGLGMAWILGLHVFTGWREWCGDREHAGATADGFVEVCAVADIPENRARVVTLGGERVAVFRYDGKVSALSSVCRHQNGPLGEGCVVDGFVTCPWHGYQYLPETGASPPPFTESVPTFAVKIVMGQVWVHPRPNAPGTRVEPAKIG
ncbi:MAG: ferric reductase-like transmembrane domain-containing protein [Verrucomicrobia bacterium]|nr:ferric reductase-like transmembrane domain-containing protein [Verrucomicrobiota bacterium]